MNIYPFFKLGGPPRALIMPFSYCDMSSKTRLVERRHSGQELYVSRDQKISNFHQVQKHAKSGMVRCISM